MLDISGKILELAGVLCTVIGIWQTWKRYGPQGEWIFGAPIRSAIQAVWVRAVPILRWLTFGHYPKRKDVRVTAGTAVLTATTHAAGVVTTNDLPRDTAAALAILNTRTNRLEVALAQARAEAERVAARVQASVAELTEALEGERAAREQDARRVALDGLRLQGLGIAFVGIGVALQFIGLFVG